MHAARVNIANSAHESSLLALRPLYPLYLKGPADCVAEQQVVGMKIVLIAVVVAIPQLFTDSTATRPGFRTALTSRGLNYGAFVVVASSRCLAHMYLANNITPVCKVAVPILEKKISSLTIPEIRGNADTPIGSVSYEMKK